MQADPKGWLTFKEFEAVLWTFAQLEDYPEGFSRHPNDPLSALQNEGYRHTEIVQACQEMQSRDDGYWLSDGLTPLKKSILRVSVENLTWIRAYIEHGPLGSSDEEECRAVLRGLAAKLESVGIEVNHIPNG